MPSDDRDPKFERALAHHLRGGPGQGACPDAGTLAAYHERTLSLEEMARWKQHIAACDACQEALSLLEVTENELAEAWEEEKIPVMADAAPLATLREKRMAASSPPPAAATLPMNLAPKKDRGRPLLMRWAIPVGALAAGALIWIGVHEQHLFNGAQHPENTTIALSQPASAPEPRLTDKESAPLDRGGARAELDALEARKTPPVNGRELKKLEALSPRAAAKDEDGAKKSITGSAGTALNAPAPPPLPPAAPASSANEITQSVEVQPAAPAPGQPSRSDNALFGGAAGVPSAEADAKRDAPAAKAKSETQAQRQAAAGAFSDSMARKQGAASQLVQKSSSASGFIFTPDAKVFWRLASPGAVSLTTDGGKTWQTLNTGASFELTAGSAPSSDVCWFAGKGGTLMLTTDRGKHWKQIATPIPGDLGGVHASDAQHASIWARANQEAFETTDGGATWKQVASD